MIKRCVMIFPQFDNMAKIDTIRDKYDSLAKLVRPHMTVGKLDDLTQYEKAIKQLAHFDESFETEVRSISVEIIGGNENSLIETVVALA